MNLIVVSGRIVGGDICSAAFVAANKEQILKDIATLVSINSVEGAPVILIESFPAGLAGL